MNATGQRDDGLSEALHAISWLGPARYDIVAACVVPCLGRMDMAVVLWTGMTRPTYSVMSLLIGLGSEPGYLFAHLYVCLGSSHIN